MFKGLQAAAMGVCLALFGLCHSTRGAEGAAPAGRTPPSAPAGAAPTVPAAPSQPAGSGSAAGAPGSAAAPMSATRVIEVLDQTVDWYRTLALQQQAANEPSDMLFFYDNRQTAATVMSLAFDIARADADLLAKEQPASQGAGDSAISAQTLLQFKQKLDAQSTEVRAALDTERRALTTASKKARPELAAKINELEGVLDLVNTKKSILGTMTDFVAGAGGTSAGSLKAQIDAMAVATPATGTGMNAPASAASTTSTTSTASPAAGSAAAPSLFPTMSPAATVGRFGLWDLAANAFRLSQKASTILSIDRRSAALQATLDQIRAPLLDRIKQLSARGDALAAQSDSADAATLNGVHDELDALAVEFKQTSALLIPLSREAILLGQYRHNLSNWRESINGQYRNAIKVLSIRMGVVLVVLAILFGAAELWRRTVLHYIQDSRRRYQLLLLRRIALWSLVFIVIGIAFASELGSIVTFAGLITAGIAVAMQSVLVSIVGYFFLIGKYGIRVGDRVQIGEVAGEVIDLGLVRMYLMELGAKGTMGPTGRVVAFANSVVFQVSSGLFKQIPGVNFAWREVVLSLPPGADYAAAKQKLMTAVTDALTDYRAEIIRQTKEIERTTLSSSAGDAQPQVQLHFSAGSVEAHVRYPVHLQHAAEIDERVTEALAAVVSHLPAAAAVPAPAG
jgi:small-conductance mechanosensitive channel